MSPLRAFVLLIVMMAAGCTSETSPRAIAFGHEACSHCKMVITDRRFGGEIVTKKGKVYPFDSLECLQKFASSHTEETSNAGIYVVDSFNSGELIDIKMANFALSETVQAPMGRALFSSKDIKKLSSQLPKAKVMNWDILKGQL